ncbi:hypothetical protein QFZ65_001464 [Arthrobacter sp. B3I9]|uniref:LysM peptidoglycan-binding domain-containing protein n=1 Tax=Arthrobacter sp. B3I9 TaxID=3042270 RepID=UPI002790CDDD|nr:LysM domain-containing protein [Arthrobacter sp. B3I9]MDQ0849526.1 hypothetical protein [Arthrobacter sp. B3I9]
MEKAKPASEGARAGRYLPAADASMAAAILLLGLFLAGSGDRLVQRWRSSSARQQSLSFEDQLGLAANTAGLILILWWLISLMSAVVSALLQRSGRIGAAAVTARFSPAFMRRLALAALGFQLLSAPLATAASLAGPDPLPSPAVSALWTPTTATAEGLVLPLPLRGLAAPPGPVPEAAPAPASASSASASASWSSRPGPPAPPSWTPQSPTVDPGALVAGQLRVQEPADGVAEVTVRAGDTLWSLAASRLGPLASDVDIAREWPRLYRENREVIGESPHLLHPGQVLRLPARE